jgi:ribosome-associated toxin RatA of RatAB toxin-antitoxin module
MKNVHKSVLIGYTAEQMFSLVTDVARYPEFLPWCDHARVLSEGENEMTAEVGMSIGGIKQAFVTRNTHVPGRSVKMELIKGPFSKLDGVWQFHPLGDVGSRVELDLRYDFSSRTLGAVVGPVFDRIASSLVDAFVKRAETKFG